MELDPRNFDTLQQISLSYEYLGRYAKAIAALDRALAIVPDNVETRANRAEYELFWKADTRPLRQTIDAILVQGPGAIARAASSWFDFALAERRSGCGRTSTSRAGRQSMVGRLRDPSEPQLW